MNKEKIKSLSKTLYFDLSNEQLIELEKEFIEIQQKIDVLKKINTDNIESTNFCLVSSNSNLRKDEIVLASDNKKHLSNAKQIINDYVVIK